MKLDSALFKDFPFSTHEFVIDPDSGLSVRIAQKIWQMHILPMLPIRLDLNIPLWASMRSCYRSKDHETQQGRTPQQTPSGRWSQHTFDPDVAPDGACDWTTSTIDNLSQLGEALANRSTYRRIAIYGTKNFFHCDYYGGDEGTFCDDPDARLYYSQNWERISKNEFIKRSRVVFNQ